MSGLYTYEGKTGMPVYPTSAHISFANESDVSLNDDATSWKEMAGVLATAPSETLVSEVLNDAPVKIIPSTSGANVNIWPGVYKCHVFIQGFTATDTVEPRVAVTDSHASAVTTFMELDMRNLPIGIAGETFTIALCGLVSVSETTDIRLVICDSQNTGQWDTADVRMTLRRLCDYVAS